MAPSNRITQTRRFSSRWLIALGSGVVLVAAIWMIVGLRRPPPLDSDAEVRKTIDALFTAITARDETLVTGCEQRLSQHRVAGKLSPAAAVHLDQIVQRARAGTWEPAARELYVFIQGP